MQENYSCLASRFKFDIYTSQLKSIRKKKWNTNDSLSVRHVWSYQLNVYSSVYSHEMGKVWVKLFYGFIPFLNESFLVFSNCFYTMKTIERYISIWMLCQIYPVACGMLSVWWEAKTFSVREKRMKLYLIWVLIWVPQAYPAAVSMSKRQHWICLFNEIIAKWNCY